VQVGLVVVRYAACVAIDRVSSLAGFAKVNEKKLFALNFLPLIETLLT
jgi:hypothetical protein